jgi:prevent-host-death family protein
MSMHENPPFADLGSITGYGYNGHVRSVNIAELKDQLSSFLHRVRAGEELVIRDRNLPIAKIVPLHSDDGDPEELALVASGHMTVPAKQLDQKRFWSIGGRMKKSATVTRAIQQAIAADRKDYAGLLGHKRDHSHLRTRAKRQRG